MGTKFILGQEDGTIAGGNARGEGAVDLQTIRSNANQVAAGIGGFIGGGGNNRTGENADYFMTIVGGASNTILFGGHSFIGGGQLNTINTGSGTGAATISGGRSNSVNSQYSTVSGGQSNTASTNSHATVVGGQTNTSSGQHSVSGGQGNTASSTRAVAIGLSNIASGIGASVAIGNSNSASADSAVAIGRQNTASNVFSCAFGSFNNVSGGSSVAIGNGNTITGSYGFSLGRNTSVTSPDSGTAIGLGSTSYLYAQSALASGTFIGQIAIQQSLLTARQEAILTTGGTAVLSLDGTGVTNLIIPTGPNRMWNVTIKYVAVVTTITGTATGVTVGDTKSQNIEIGFKKVGGVSSLVGGGSFSIPQENASMGSASLIPTAGASQELALTFTAPTFAGGGSVTCRVVAKVELVEVAF